MYTGCKTIVHFTIHSVATLLVTPVQSSTVQNNSSLYIIMFTTQTYTYILVYHTHMAGGVVLQNFFHTNTFTSDLHSLRYIIICLISLIF